MKKIWKYVFGGALIVAISSAVAVGTNTYLMSKRQHTDSAMMGGVFTQPVRMTNLAAVAAENIDFTKAAEATIHAVVHIKSTVMMQAGRGGEYIDPFEFFFGHRGFSRPQPQPQEGAGSGVIISTDGYILTNNHVIDAADKIEVTLNDNRQYTAKVVGTDPQTDIALIKIEEKDLPTIPFGDSESLKVGEWVLAVGNPFNLTSTVTAGIVSAKGRSISPTRANVSQIQSFIQTDAAVNPGNSGGALVNTKGELIGINTAIYSQTGNFAGYSFAVPISIAGKVAADIKEYGAVQRAMLGVLIADIQNVPEEDRKNVKVLEGAYIAGFAERSTAQEAGIAEGDVVISINDVKIKSANSLQEQISKFRPGDKVKVKVNRKGTEKTLTVELRNAQGSTEVTKGGDTAEVLGVAFKVLSDTQKKELNVSYGIEVTGVTNGKLRDAGIKKGFIIMIVNNQKISSVDDIEKLVDKILKGSSEEQGLFIKGFYPNGRTRYYAIDLAE